MFNRIHVATCAQSAILRAPRSDARPPAFHHSAAAAGQNGCAKSFAAGGTAAVGQSGHSRLFTAPEC